MNLYICMCVSECGFLSFWFRFRLRSASLRRPPQTRETLSFPRFRIRDNKLVSHWIQLYCHRAACPPYVCIANCSESSVVWHAPQFLVRMRNKFAFIIQFVCVDLCLWLCVCVRCEEWEYYRANTIIMNGISRFRVSYGSWICTEARMDDALQKTRKTKTDRVSSCKKESEFIGKNSIIDEYFLYYI